MKGPLLQKDSHCDTLKWWNYDAMCFLNHFYRFHVILLALKICKCTPTATAVSLLAFNHKSDRRADNFSGLTLEKWCSAVEIKYFLMFIHVHFVFQVNMKTRSVHVFELRQYSNLSRHIEEPQSGIYCCLPEFLKKMSQLKIWGSWDLVSYQK